MWTRRALPKTLLQGESREGGRMRGGPVEGRTRLADGGVSAGLKWELESFWASMIKIFLNDIQRAVDSTRCGARPDDDHAGR